MRYPTLFAICFFGTFLLVPAVASAATITRPTNDLGLVSYWTMDGGDMNWSTNEMRDASGNGNTMLPITLSTTTAPTLGKFGQAFTFDQNGYLNTGTTYSALDGSTGLTVCGWANLNTLGTTNDNDDSAIFAVNSSASGSIILWYNVNAAGTGDHAYTFNVGATSNAPGRVNGSTSATAGVWQFVCGVMSGSNRYIYLNGSLDGSTTGAITTSYTSANSAAIGRWSGGTSQLMNGKIDDVRIYNRALSATEIAELYGKGAAHVNASSATLQAGTTLADGLNGYWTLDGVDTNWTTNQVTDRSNGTTDAMSFLSTSTAPVAGKLGQALKFDGITSYINTGAWNSQATVYSVSLWAKIPSGGSGGTAFTRGDSSQCFYNPSISVNLTSFTIAESGCSGSGKIADTVALDSSVWNHIVEVRSGSSNTTYLNGAVVATRSYSPNCTTLACTSGTSRRVQIGAGWHADNGIVSNYGGIVDDVRTYNRALSASEVQQLYRLGNATANASSATLTSGSSLQSGLTGHWTLDGKDTNWKTNQETDKSGSGNTGTLTSLSTTTTPTIGKVGQAFNFKAAGGYVKTSMIPGSQGTAIAWIKPNVTFSGASANDMSIVDTGNAGRNVFFRVNWAKGLLLTTNCNSGATRAQGEINFVISPSSPNYSVSCTTTTTWNANQWYMLAATWDGTTQKLYVNGVLEDSVSQTQSGGWGGAEIGAAAAGAFPFNGSIDDVRVYNRVLSAAEIKQFYNLTK